MVASPKTVAEFNKDRRFYKLEVVFDPKSGMQIKQDSNQVGPFDIMGALMVVHGMHQKYFVDAFSQQINKPEPKLNEEQRKRFDDAMKKTLNDMGLDEKGDLIKEDKTDE